MSIVITGNIGCGKSTFSKMLMEHLPTYKLLDIDVMIHALYEEPYFKSLLEAEFNTCDRKAVSDIVFANPRKLEKLELITKEIVINQVWNQIKFHKVVLDFPLYFEHGAALFHGKKDVVITVHCDEATQRERIAARGRFSPEKTDVIIGRQYSSLMKAVLADYAVDSTVSLPEMEKRAKKIAEEIKIKALRERFLSSFPHVDMWESIEAQYSYSGRHYHGMSHLMHLFAEFDKHKHHIRNPQAVELAIWYHDFFYDTDQQSYPTNELRSAAKLWEHARTYFTTDYGFKNEPDVPAFVQLAVEMILSTKGHKVTSPYVLSKPLMLADAKLFLDMDLSSLSPPLDVALAMDQKIRQEFMQYDDVTFAKGRVDALGSFLTREQLFQSPAYAHLEQQAKSNLEVILDRYKKQIPPPPDFNRLLRDALGIPKKGNE